MLGTGICSEFTQSISLTHHLWAPSLCGTGVGWLSCVLQCCLPSSLCFLDTHTFKEATFASQVSQTVISDIFQKSLGDWRATLTKSIKRTCDPTYSSESKIYLTSRSKGGLFLPPTPKLAWHGLCYFGFYPIFGERNMRNYQTQVYPWIKRSGLYLLSLLSGVVGGLSDHRFGWP